MLVCFCVCTIVLQKPESNATKNGKKLLLNNCSKRSSLSNVVVVIARTPLARFADWQTATNFWSIETVNFGFKFVAFCVRNSVTRFFAQYFAIFHNESFSKWHKIAPSTPSIRVRIHRKEAFRFSQQIQTCQTRDEIVLSIILFVKRIGTRLRSLVTISSTRWLGFWFNVGYLQHRKLDQ